MTQEAQIIGYENRLLEAMKSSDIDALEKLLHDSLVFNIPTGQTITKTMDIENYRSGVMVVYDISTTDQTIQIIEEAATVVVTAHLKAKYAEQIIDQKFRYLRVWKMFGNAWKIIAGSSVQV